MAMIEKRKGTAGAVAYRVRIRRRGYPEYTETFTRKADAEAWAKQVEADLQRGRYLPSNDARRRTVAEMIERYVTEILPHKPRNKSASATKAQLERWKKELGAYVLAGVTPAAISDCKSRLLSETTPQGKRRSPATVNRYLAALSVVFETARKEWTWIEHNPCGGVARGAETRGRVRWLDDDERARLLDVCGKSTEPDLLPLVKMALSTGARQGELLGLGWKDVDLSRGVVTFQQTKNDERRSVPIVGSVLATLGARSHVRRIGDDRIFTVTRSRLDKAFRQAIAAAQIEDFRFHDLRHSAASYLAMSGATTAEIAAVLGHKTLQMVKRYAHLGEQHTVDVLTRMIEKVGL